MELEAYKSGGSWQNLMVLRQGLFVLRALAVAADTGKSRTFESLYASVRDDYLLLISGVVQIFRQRDLGIPEHESMCVLCRCSVASLILEFCRHCWYPHRFVNLNFNCYFIIIITIIIIQ